MEYLILATVILVAAVAIYFFKVRHLDYLKQFYIVAIIISITFVAIEITLFNYIWSIKNG